VLLQLAGVQYNGRAGLHSLLTDKFPQMIRGAFPDSSLPDELIWVANVLRLMGNTTKHDTRARPNLAYNEHLIALACSARCYELMLDTLTRLASLCDQEFAL